MPLRSLLLVTTMTLTVTVIPTTAPAAAAAAENSCPTIVGHKAGGRSAPENTVPGLNLMADEGTPIVEIDIRWNKSNFAFAFHDEDISRTTNGTGRVQDHWLPDLQKLTAADYAPWNTDPRYAGFNPDGTPKVRPPYAYDFLYAAKKAKVKLLLDVKVTPTKEQADLFASYLDRPELQMRKQIIWMANSAAGLTTMRGWYPDLTYFLIERPPAGFMRTAESLLALGTRTYTVPVGEVRSADYVDYYHQYGIAVSTWTTDNPSLDTPENWAKVTRFGVDYITTDKPGEALAQQDDLCAAGTP